MRNIRDFDIRGREDFDGIGSGRGNLSLSRRIAKDKMPKS